MLRHLVWLIATIAAFVVCLVIPYPLGTKARANGIPLPYVIWEQLENGAWADFVGGCGTLVALPLDFTVAAGFSILAWRLLNRLSAHPDDAPPAASDQPV
jgi:hypothetical protein